MGNPVKELKNSMNTLKQSLDGVKQSVEGLTNIHYSYNSYLLIIRMRGNRI
ncbi:hypothetical protein D3C76_220810 [compost metagenome]